MWERIADDPERDYTGTRRLMLFLTPVALIFALVNLLQSDTWLAATFATLALALFQSARLCTTISMIQEG